MTNLIRSNIQAHTLHLVSPSPWRLEVRVIKCNTFKRNYADSTDPASTRELTIVERSNLREDLEAQRDQSEQEKTNSEDEMVNNFREFEDYYYRVLRIEIDRHEGLTEQHAQQASSQLITSVSQIHNLEDEVAELNESNNNNIFVELRYSEILKENTRIASEFSKFNKDFNDKNSTIEGDDVNRDATESYDSLVEKREQAEKAAIESCDKHIANVQKVIEIESQLRSLEDSADNGPATGNDAGNGDSSGPQAGNGSGSGDSSGPQAGNGAGSDDSSGPQAGNNAGSLLDDYADPNLEQPSHMDSDD